MTTESSILTTSVAAFRAQAHEHGYASGDARSWRKEADGSTTIAFEAGGWRSHDSFFGGEPYGGREVVFREGAPVWVMVYYGFVEESEADAAGVYAFLRKALAAGPGRGAVVRGPASFAEGGFTYTSECEGDLGRFDGTEEIHREGRRVYWTRYAGGLVDRRPGV